MRCGSKLLKQVITTELMDIRRTKRICNNNKNKLIARLVMLLAVVVHLDKLLKSLILKRVKGFTQRSTSELH
jgi:hypothetical protein